MLSAYENVGYGCLFREVEERLLNVVTFDYKR